MVQFQNMLKEAQEGDGTATRHLANVFKQSPELLNDPGLDRMVRARAAARLERDLEYARLTGDRPSEATMNSLRLLAEGGLPGLFQGLDRKEFLPALFLALGIPLLGQADRSTDKRPTDDSEAVIGSL